jgi:hypothetical protein
MYYSYVEIEYVATSFSPARTDLALKLLIVLDLQLAIYCDAPGYKVRTYNTEELADDRRKKTVLRAYSF